MKIITFEGLIFFLLPSFYRFFSAIQAGIGREEEKNTSQDFKY